MMQTSSSAARPLSEELATLLGAIEDDTEEAPWMVMGSQGFWAASDFAQSLRLYARRQGRAWDVLGMLPLLYPNPQTGRQNKVAPDVCVLLGPEQARSSYDLGREGPFPPFVLEVLSLESVLRDQTTKRDLFDWLGAGEYVLYGPNERLLRPQVQGYRRTADGVFAPWEPGPHGRLWSAALELWVGVQEGALRAWQADGRLLLTPQELQDARDQEASARQQAEEELARLRAELERYRQNE